MTKLSLIIVAIVYNIITTIKYYYTTVVARYLLNHVKSQNNNFFSIGNVYFIKLAQMVSIIRLKFKQQNIQNSQL